MRRRLFAVVPLAAGVLLASCGSATVAASVGGRTITTGELNQELADVAANKAFVSELAAAHEPVFGPGHQSYTALFVDNILSRRITIMRVQEALAHLHVKATPLATQLATALAEQSAGGQSTFAGFPRTYQQRLIRDSADIVELEAKLGGVSLVPGAVEAYYRSHPSQFLSYCGSEILTGTPVAANAALAQLKGGESFASVAHTASTQNPQGGGALGCGTQAQYAASFGPTIATMVTSLPLGRPSEVVQVSNGFAIFEVTQRQTIPFSQAELLAADSLIAHGQALLNDYLARTVRSANVHVNPALGKVVISKGVLSVVPSVPSGATLSSQIVAPKPVG